MARIWDFKKNAWDKEWERMQEKERRLTQQKQNSQPSAINRLLADKVPEKLSGQLNTAFAKAFELVFEKGMGVIEKTYDREKQEDAYKINEFAAQLKQNKTHVRKFSKQARRSNAVNVAFSCVEGIGLGVLGIGLPDIVLLVGVMLRSVYQTAMSYGFAYDTPEEQLFLLQLMEAALCRGAAFEERNDVINAQIDSDCWISYDRKEQIQKTSRMMSIEMLCMKFIQGAPIVGVIGGLSDCVYVRQVSRYAELKYQRRFLRAKR